MRIRPVGAEVFHADGQRDMTKLIVAVRKNFENALTNVKKFKIINILGATHLHVETRRAEPFEEENCECGSLNCYNTHQHPRCSVERFCKQRKHVSSFGNYATFNRVTCRSGQVGQQRVRGDNEMEMQLRRRDKE